MSIVWNNSRRQQWRRVRLDRALVSARASQAKARRSGLSPREEMEAWNAAKTRVLDEAPPWQDPTGMLAHLMDAVYPSAEETP